LTSPMAATGCGSSSTTAARASSVTARVSQPEGAQRHAAEHEVRVAPGQLGPRQADAERRGDEALELVGLQLGPPAGGVAGLRAVAELERAPGHERPGPAGREHAHPLLVGVVERPAAAAAVAPPDEEPPGGGPGQRDMV